MEHRASPHASTRGVPPEYYRGALSTLEVPVRLPVEYPVSTPVSTRRVPQTASTHLGAEPLRQRARHAVLDRGSRAERQPQRAAAAVRLTHLPREYSQSTPFESP